MSAHVPDTPALPVVYRPLGVRIAAVALGVLLIGSTAVIWFAFPQDVRDQFNLLQRLTVLGFGAVAVAAGYALGRSRVEARDEGLLVVNGYRRRLLPWSAVRRVVLRQGAPWAIAEVGEDETVSLMGIQGSDGSRAVVAVRELRAVLAVRHGSRDG